MKLILLGAPGVGKGTQAEVICKKFSIPTISTGEIIREAVRNGTDMGNKAMSFMNEGKLVPDEVVIDIIKDRLSKEDCKNGFILDGYPRTVPQAEALSAMGVDIDKVISIEVPDERIIRRLSGRRVCKNCGASYHLVHKPSKINEVCDLCSGELIQRRDDHPDTVLNRLQVFHKQTEPLKDYYEKTGKLTLINGQKLIEDTTNEVLKAFEA